MIPREKGKRERETDDRSFPADKMKIHLIPAMLSTFPFLDEGGGRGSVFFFWRWEKHARFKFDCNAAPYRRICIRTMNRARGFISTRRRRRPCWNGRQKRISLPAVWSIGRLMTYEGKKKKEKKRKGRRKKKRNETEWLIYLIALHGQTNYTVRCIG